MEEFHSIEIITMPRLNNLINEHFSWKMFSKTRVSDTECFQEDGQKV